MYPNNGSLIGEGSYAQVTSSGKLAVKVIPHQNFESAMREICLVNTCDHPNVIKIRKVEIDTDSTKIHMKKYPCDLSRYLGTWGLLPLETVFEIARGLISGIAHVHGRGIIHGDIKPQNILLCTPANAQPVPVICDFGIAVSGDEKYHTSRVQTCTYRAPEVDYDRSRIQYSTRIDMWSIGCILLELASGLPAVKYVQEIEDSSWYACNLLGIYVCENRRQRLKLLRGVTHKYVCGIICDKLHKDPNRYRVMFDSGFIRLISMCLHPNHNKRVDANSALSFVNHLFGNSIVHAQIPKNMLAEFPKVCVDEMICVRNIDQRIISICTESCLILAEQMYRRYMEIANIENEETKYACIFIATCIYSGSLPAVSLLTKHITRAILYNAAGTVMLTLDGRIIKK
jgi:serine/threonine protein kinase